MVFIGPTVNNEIDMQPLKTPKFTEKKEDVGKVAGDTYNLSKFSSFFYNC